MIEEYLLVADIGGTRIRMAFIGLDSKTLPDEPEEHWTTVLNGEDALDVLKRLLTDYVGKSGRNPVGVVIGLPGVIDTDNDLVLMCNNIPSLTGCRLATALKHELKAPVLIEHDTKMLLAGELSGLDDPDDEIALGVFFGTGVGADVMLKDRECRVFQNGLELGHMPLSMNGEKCVCGKIGCAETFISGHKLNAMSDAFNIPIKEVFSRWGEDSMLGRRLKEFVDYQAMILAIAVTIINPTLLIIGGGIVDMKMFPKEYLKRGLSLQLLNLVPRERFSIAWAEHGNRAGFYGGYYLFKERFK